MSSLSDLQNAIVNIIAPAMYPNGTSNPSIANTDIFIFPGDPIKLDLDNLLLQKKIVVAVFAVNGMTRNTTRLPRKYVDQVIDVATIILTVAGNTVTVSGTVTAGQASMVVVDGTGYAYLAQEGDTVNTIAQNLTDLIPNATVVNNVITIAGTYDIIARVSVQGSARQILHSREAIVRARVIAPSHELRELVGNAVELAIAKNGYYLPMPDLISASIRPNRISELNPYELDLAFVRDYLYLVEYHLVNVEEFQSIADAYAITTID